MVRSPRLLTRVLGPGEREVVKLFGVDLGELPRAQLSHQVAKRPRRRLGRVRPSRERRHHDAQRLRGRIVNYQAVQAVPPLAFVRLLECTTGQKAVPTGARGVLYCATGPRRSRGADFRRRAGTTVQPMFEGLNFAAVTATPHSEWTFAELRDADGVAALVELTCGADTGRAVSLLAELVSALAGRDDIDETTPDAALGTAQRSGSGGPRAGGGRERVPLGHRCCARGEGGREPAPGARRR